MVRRLLLLLLLAGPAHAEVTPHQEGDYGGVAPGQKAEAAARPAKPKRAPPRGTLSWIGFEAKDGGAQVFLQSVAPFEVTQRVDGATLVVHTTLRRLGDNTWRPIDTRFFDTPIARITAKAVRASRARKGRPGHAAGVELRITFKNARDAREATLRTATEDDAMFYAYLAWPAAAASEPASSDEPAR